MRQNRRRYITGDQSRNSWLLALLTMGEGWHNNHHACQASARQGFRWWEFDPTFYMLRALSCFGLVWDLHVPPKALVRGEHKLGRRVINEVGGQLAASFPINVIANQALEILARAPNGAELKSRILPQVSTLDEVRCYAGARLAETPSLDEIALSARQRLLELVYSRLIEAAASSSADKITADFNGMDCHRNPRHFQVAGVLNFPITCSGRERYWGASRKPTVQQMNPRTSRAMRAAQRQW